MDRAREPIVRVALAGRPGAGKSTTAGLVSQALSARGRRVAVVGLAAPLYDVQDRFHHRLGTPLDPGRQDGALLNFLGSHFRDTAPGFLLADFERRCTVALAAGADAVVCDDARPADLRGLAAQGFTVVSVTAPDAVRHRRKAARHDRTTGQDDHVTELGDPLLVPDVTIDNRSGLQDLRDAAEALAARLIAEPRPAVAAPDPVGSTARSLLAQAEAAITRRYAVNRHQIAAAAVDRQGRVFTGLHVEAMVGRASVCAEAVALGKACEAGADDLELIVAVRHPTPTEVHDDVRIVPPCGLCRELLLDYAPAVRVLVPAGDEITVVPLADLLPHKYVGTKWAAERSTVSVLSAEVPSGAAR